MPSHVENIVGSANRNRTKNVVGDGFGGKLGQWRADWGSQLANFPVRNRWPNSVRDLSEIRKNGGRQTDAGMVA